MLYLRIVLILLLLAGIVTELDTLTPFWKLIIIVALLTDLLVFQRRVLVQAMSSNPIGVLRMRWLTSPLLKLFKRLVPRMSQTEREALDAGSVWWDGELFSGKPSWNKLRNTKLPSLSTEERAFLDGPVNTLCEMLDDWHITHERYDLPPEVWQYIKENRFLSMILPKRYGGLEFSALAHSAVVMKVSTRSVSAAVTVMVPNSLGPGKLLLEYGTEAQKDYYLPRLAIGQEIPCFALTNPEAGSDAGAIPDFGIVCRGDFQDRKNILGLRLTWNKRYITLGPVATILGLAFKLFDPEHLLGEKEELGVTLALIPTNTPGVNIGRRHFPLNLVFMNGPNSGNDVFIPMDYIIGGQERIGQGWRMLMECLADGRSISLPALSVGSGKLICRAVGAYARVRRQFKLPIGRFEGVEEALGRIGGYTYMMDAARELTAGGLDLGEKPSVISAIVKYHLTENMRRVVDDAMDILGGAGICMGPKNFIARAYQAVPISITVEGANILTRSMIIFGQGAIRSHPFIFQEMQAVNESEVDWDVSLKKFDRAFFGHMGFFIRNIFRSFFHGLTAGHFAISGSQRPMQRYYQKLTRMSSAFALLTDIAIFVLGGSLKRREKLSARLGDVLSNLYLASAVLKRFETQGCLKEDVPFLRWGCEQSLYNIQLAIDGFLQNFPNRLIACWLQWIIFPLGRSLKQPNDNLGGQIADILLSPSPERNRLTTDIFISRNEKDTLARLEDALMKTIKAEQIERRLRQQMENFQPGYQVQEKMLKVALEKKFINEDDAKILRDAELARWNVIQVDDFSRDFKS